MSRSLVPLLFALSACGPDVLDVLGDEIPGPDTIEQTDPDPDPLLVTGEMSRVEGADLEIRLFGWDQDEAVEIEWSTGEVSSAIAQFVDGVAVLLVEVPDPCRSFAEGELDAFVVSDDWTIRVEVELVGEVIQVDEDPTAVIEYDPVVLCGSADQVDLWVAFAGPHHFDVYGDPWMVLRHGQATANLYDMNLPEGASYLDVTRPLETPYVVVVDPIGG